MRTWTTEMIDYLKEVAPGKLNSEITELINKKFNTNFTTCAVGCKKTRLKTLSNSKYMPKYTPEVIAFILENYQGKDNIELAKLLNERFNLNTNAKLICNFKSNYKRRFGVDLRTGINRGCYKKGSIPFNKGTKGLCKPNKTSFKKGNIPQNHRPVGSERINVDGYVEIKVAEPNKWKNKGRVIYESVYGEIPKGHALIYLDGNKQNLDISNLKLIDRAEELIMNRRKLRYKNKELTETGLLIAKVIHKRGQRTSERL